MKKLLIFIVILAIIGLGGYYALQYVSFEQVQEAKNDAKKISQEIIDLPGKNSWEFIVVGDNEGVNDTSRKFIEEANASDAELVVNVGDFVQDGTKKEFEEILKLYNGLNKAWYPTLGNNDMGSVLDYDDGNYKKYMREDLYYSFDHKNAHFIILDNANRTIGFDDEQLDWLAEDLAGNEQPYTFIFFHKPFKVPFEEFFGDDETPVSRESNERFLEIIAPYKIDQIFTGHVHNYLSYSIGEVPVVITGGGGAAPQASLGGEESAYYHYIEATVSDDGYDYKVKEIN